MWNSNSLISWLLMESKETLGDIYQSRLPARRRSLANHQQRDAVRGDRQAADGAR
jgi:hypothetical protein